MKKTNDFLTSDIRIQTDSVGMMTASHKLQGMLLDWSFFDNRAACRREAVEVLKAMKNGEHHPAMGEDDGWGDDL